MRAWLVDPLCGTLNCAARTPLVAVNIALRTVNGVTAAVTADPLSGEVFWTGGDGAFIRRDGGRAIPLHEATLADRRRVLGADHPNTLISCNNLAGAFQMIGDLGRAISLHEKNLADVKECRGPVIL